MLNSELLEEFQRGSVEFHPSKKHEARSVFENLEDLSFKSIPYQFSNHGVTVSNNQMSHFKEKKHCVSQFPV